MAAPTEPEIWHDASAVGAIEDSPALQRWVGVDFISRAPSGRHKSVFYKAEPLYPTRTSLPAFAKGRRKVGEAPSNQVSPCYPKLAVTYDDQFLRSFANGANECGNSATLTSMAEEDGTDVGMIH